MQALNFEYDGKLLSDFGFIICDFNFSSGVSEISAGSVITFNKTPRNQGKRFSLTNTQYDECITSTFDICKDPDEYDLENFVISNDEYIDLMRWLNRREFLRFNLVVSGDMDSELCFYNASFNVSKLKIQDKLYGLRLTMETDKPFGYGLEESVTWTFNNSTVSKTYYDKSTEIGSIRPTIIVVCKNSGDLQIKNESEDCVSVIKNCKNGEKITMYGDTQIITSSLKDHDVCNDFNYEFFRIGNTASRRENIIKVSLPCDFTMKYSPIIKDTP